MSFLDHDSKIVLISQDELELLGGIGGQQSQIFTIVGSYDVFSLFDESARPEHLGSLSNFVQNELHLAKLEIVASLLMPESAPWK